jgi:hypothetical protein
MIKKIRLVLILSLFGILLLGFSQERNWPEKNFYANSLHYTNRGIAFWYSEEQGGLERLTGIPISSMDCQRCHVQTCDACHAKEENGVLVYSVEKARSQEACTECHGIGDVENAKANGQPVDVHFEMGIKCLDCHTTQDVHGDGTMYNTYHDEGAVDARCENCHDELSASPSHEVHQGQLDCNACHLQNVSSCLNCHFDTRVKENKSVSLPLENVLFMVNAGGKVTLATCLSFVYQNKTMIEFSPSFSHLVTGDGRKCEECHATQIIQNMAEKKFILAKFENGKLINVKGIVPVLEHVKWNIPFLNYDGGQWVPIPNPAEPIIQYSGYCTPLTADQFQKLRKAQPEKE